MSSILIGVHVATITGLALYGFLGFFALWLFLRHKDEVFIVPHFKQDDLPFVTVQLPVYNEREVIQRLIAAVASLDYPQDLLEIQVADDSSDETTLLAAEAIAKYKAEGANISLIHRENRQGFKAGALQTALQTAKGQYIAIFDADFLPSTDFLMRTVPFFLDDHRLGVVQARWGHLNDSESPLTGAQAIALDKHFAVEQLIRHRADIYPKFNGAAGVWRKSCIEDAGGWQDDTACEDLCLSIRAALRGWRFHYAHEVITPAELPSTIVAYKIQQARWSLGATQCLKKYGDTIWHDKAASLTARLYTLFAMSAYMTNVLVLLLLLIQLPMLLLESRPPEWLYLLGLIGLGQPILFVIGQVSLYKDWISRLRYLPALLVIAIGIAPSNAYAIARALFQHSFTFLRTPKGPAGSYEVKPGRMLVVELIFGVYSLAALLMAITVGNPGPVILLSSATVGFGYVAYLSLRDLYISK